MSNRSINETLLDIFFPEIGIGLWVVHNNLIFEEKLNWKVMTIFWDMNIV